MKFLLALLGGAKYGKFLLTAGTMVLSVAAYAMLYGWAWAAGLVGLIFVHEGGHYLAARGKGIEVGAPVFIPFVGAWVALRTEHLTAATEAEIALAGPVLGSIGAFLCYLYARHDGGSFWLSLAYAGFLLNLVNLVPVRFLDGGRVARAVSERLWLLGAPLLLAFFVWQPNPLVLVILLVSLPDLWRAIRNWGAPPAEVLPQSLRLGFGAAYFGLVASLSAICLELHEILRLPA